MVEQNRDPERERVVDFAGERMRRVPMRRVTDDELDARMKAVKKAADEEGAKLSSEDRAAVDRLHGTPDSSLTEPPLNPRTRDILLDLLAQKASAEVPGAVVKPFRKKPQPERAPKDRKPK